MTEECCAAIPEEDEVDSNLEQCGCVSSYSGCTVVIGGSRVR